MNDKLTPYINPEGKIIAYPGKKHRALRPLIYAALMTHFEKGVIYNEPQVNHILLTWILFEDYVSLRRELVDTGLLSRTSDCRKYWVTDTQGQQTTSDPANPR